MYGGTHAVQQCKHMPAALQQCAGRHVLPLFFFLFLLSERERDFLSSFLSSSSSEIEMMEEKTEISLFLLPSSSSFSFLPFLSFLLFLFLPPCLLLLPPSPFLLLPPFLSSLSLLSSPPLSHTGITKDGGKKVYVVLPVMPACSMYACLFSCFLFLLWIEIIL